MASDFVAKILRHLPEGDCQFCRKTKEAVVCETSSGFRGILCRICFFRYLSLGETLTGAAAHEHNGVNV